MHRATRRDRTSARDVRATGSAADAVAPAGATTIMPNNAAPLPASHRRRCRRHAGADRTERDARGTTALAPRLASAGRPPANRISGTATRIANPNFEGDSTGVHAVSAMPHPGVRINQYEMIKMIGEGGMGTVYLARDLRLGRRVAIKFLQSNQPELTQRFLVEARATARCQHDNIVVIYEVGEHNNSPYMVLEFLNGKPLTETIKERPAACRTRASSRS